MGSGSELSSSASGKRHGSPPRMAAKIRKLAATPQSSSPTHFGSPTSSSYGTYVDAICAVLEEHPRGLEKEHIIRAIEAKSHTLFPGRSLETVKAGLQNAFSQHPKTRVPRMFPYGLEDGTGNRIPGKTVWALAGTDLTEIVIGTGGHTSQSQQQVACQEVVNTEESDLPSQSQNHYAVGREQLPYATKSGEIAQRPSPRSSSPRQASNLALWRSSGPGKAQNTPPPSPQLEPTQVAPLGKAAPSSTLADDSAATTTSLITGCNNARSSGQPAVQEITHLQDTAIKGIDEDEQELLKWGRLVQKRKQLRRQLDDLTEKAQSTQSRASELERERENKVLRAQTLEQEVRQAREAAEKADLDLKNFQEQSATSSKEADKIEAQISTIDVELQG